ncbi:MAG: hypothetical protein HYX63_07755 [Gammaproteobacteria bacterium]|nr:hypothetical protein [Gammaproteobacteria bacterium]
MSAWCRSRDFMLGLGLMAVAVIVCVVLYQPALHGPLVFDDYPALGPLLAMQTLPTDWPYYVMSPTGPLGRPVAMLSFLANLYWTGPSLWAWKATNLGLHCVIGVALWDVSRRLFALAPSSYRTAGMSAALVAALWLLHPLQTSTVLYTVQRMTQLSALFTTLGISLYLVGRTQTNDSWGARGALWGAYLICLPLAALSKETGLLLPAYLAVLEVTVLRDIGATSLRRQAWLLSGIFLVAPVLFVLGYAATHFESALLVPHLKRGLSLWERLMTESRVVVRYLVQIIAPNRQTLGFFHDDIAISTSLTAPITTLASLTLLLILASGGWMLRRRTPIVACGMLWFFAGHLLESTIIPLELMFEHRNYFPSFAVLLAVIGATMTLRTAVFTRTLAVSGAVASLLLFAVVTSAAVDDWRDEARFYTAAFQSHPKSPTAISQLAELFIEQKQYQEALSVLRGVPGAGAVIQRAYIECRMNGKLKGDEIDPSVINNDRILTNYAAAAIVEFAKIGLDQHCDFSREKFVNLLLAAATKPTREVRSTFLMRFYAAHYQWALKRKDDALASLDIAHRLDPADPMPLFLSSEWLLDMGDVTGGRAALSAAIESAGRSGKDYRDLSEGVSRLYRSREKSHD